MGQSALGLAIFGIAMSAAPALAQEPGFERAELVDVTVTLRDDAFSTVIPDAADAKTAYVGTYQGRFYKTTDGGQTWTESTIIPEQQLLWATPGSSTFYGSVRDAGRNAGMVDLIGRGLGPTPLTFSYVPSRLAKLPFPNNSSALAGESAVAAGGGTLTLGLGLSERSPRLSLLTASRGKPVPTLNRVRFLSDRVLRGTAIFNIAADPADRRRLFAATVNGLYQSYDGGDSWSRSFAGMTAGERTALRVAIRPGEQPFMMLGTTDGAYFSVDRGDNWSKISTLGGAINDVAFDPKDPNFIYVAANGGVSRSGDAGKTFVPSYYSTLPAEADVRKIVIDPFDPNTGYIGTMHGAYVTHKLRTAAIADWAPLEGVQSVLAVPVIAACGKHKGHLYALTRVELWTINYGADTPESAVVESWDGGKTWRQLFTGQSDGTAQMLALDAQDPDQLWIAWSSALHRLERGTAGGRAQPGGFMIEPEPGPEMGELVLAALRYHGLELKDYGEKIHKPKFGNILPRTFTVTGALRQWSVGGVQDDNQFAANRYLEVANVREWVVMAWASWNLPDLVYSPDSVPMLRQRIQIMNDELRHRITDTIRKSYGEVLRIRARLAEAKLDLKTQVIYHVRIEQLEAVIDLTSGGYLTRWKKKHRRNAR